MIALAGSRLTAKRLRGEKRIFLLRKKWPVRQASENEHRNTRNLSHFDSSLNWTTLLRSKTDFTIKCGLVKRLLKLLFPSCLS